MKRLILLAAISLTGCQAIMSTTGSDYIYNDHVYLRSFNDVAKGSEYADTMCRRVIRTTYSESDLIRSSYINKEGAALVYSCYKITREQYESEQKSAQAQRMKEIEESYKNLYMAKEKLYEKYRQDGKLHTDTYTLPDGSIHSVTIQGDKRCESYADEYGAKTTCN